MKNFNKFYLILPAIGLFFILCPKIQAATYDYDLSIIQSDVRFSKDILISGQKVRIYAKVKNAGNEDITGYVSFFRGSALIGNSLSVSVLPGTTDDVFVDFTIPEDSFNIQAKIQGTEPADQNAANDVTQTKLIEPDKDTDGDGTVDRLDADDDNDGLTDTEESAKGTNPLKADTDGDSYNDKIDAFPLNAQEWLDTDGDGIGNNADTDDDNDGWSDAQEKSVGTDPLRQDTDGDGVIDSKDFYPLDAKRSVKEAERNIFQPTTTTAPDNTAPAALDNKTDIKNLTDLQQQLDSITEVKSDNNVVDQKLDEIVEKTSSTNSSFLRLDNFILWIVLAFILVLGAIIYLWKKGNNNPALSTAEEMIILQPKQPPKPIKTTPKIELKNHPQIINLKDLKKK